MKDWLFSVLVAAIFLGLIVLYNVMFTYCLTYIQILNDAC